MATFSKQIDSNIRDLDHTYDGSWTVDQDSAWNVGNPGAVTRNIGLRFTNVTIQQGANINSAKIRFKASGTKTSTGMNIRIAGIDEDNTAEFVLSPENSARTRTKTTAYGSWTGSIPQTNGGNLDTVDITSVIQEIVDRVGWASGNAMAFFLYDNGSTSGQYISVDEYSDGSTSGATLIIDYDPAVTVDDERNAVVHGTLGANSERSASILSSGAKDTRQAKIHGQEVATSTRGAWIKGTERGNYGIKITKPGYDVKTETDLKNMIFTSARGVLGLRRVREYTSTTDANGDISLTVYHNFGYVPIVIAKTETYDEKEVTINPTEWHSFYQTGGKELVEVTELFDFNLTSTSFTMKVHAEAYNHDTWVGWDVSGRSYTFKVYYYFNEVTDQ